MEKLCNSCLKEGLGVCEFRRRAEEIAARTPLSPTLEDVVKVHNQIAGERVLAREKMCPQINQVDPDYPGKNFL